MAEGLLRFKRAPRGKAAIRSYFEAVRERWTAKLDALSEQGLNAVRNSPDAPPGITLRWWLWFALEHEIHHKGQAAVYLRLMGIAPPYYAMLMPAGARPDVDVRESMGGV